MSEIIYFHIYYQIKTHFSTNETLTVYYTQICVFTQQKYAFSITHWKEIKCFDTAQEEPRQSVHLCPGKGLSQSEEWHPEWQPETLLHSEHPYLAALASGALWERFASPSLLQSKGVLPSNSPFVSILIFLYLTEYQLMTHFLWVLLAMLYQFIVSFTVKLSAQVYLLITVKRG